MTISASSTIYGGTFNLISVTMKKMGIEATFVDLPVYRGGVERRSSGLGLTKVVFGETIANPAPDCAGYFHSRAGVARLPACPRTWTTPSPRRRSTAVP